MPKYSAAWRIFITSGDSFMFPITSLPDLRTGLPCLACAWRSLFGARAELIARSLPSPSADTGPLLPAGAGSRSFWGQKNDVNDFLSGSRRQVKVIFRFSSLFRPRIARNHQEHATMV